MFLFCRLALNVNSVCKLNEENQKLTLKSVSIQCLSESFSLEPITTNIVSSYPTQARCIRSTLCDKVCQWLAAGLWFSPGTMVSSTDKTDCHDITEILLKVALNTIIYNPESFLSHVILENMERKSNFLIFAEFFLL